MYFSLSKHPHFLLILITIAATLLAIPLLFGQSIRLDESQSIWAASRTLPGILEFMAKDVHPPLYMIMLHAWMLIFGSSVIATRILSLMFFITTIPFIFLMARSVSDSKTSLMTVVLFCLSPFILWFGTETRMYALMTMLTAISHWVYVRLIQTQAQTYKLPYLLVSLAGLYTQYFFVLLLFVQLVYALWLSKKKQFEGLTILLSIFLF